MIDPAMVKKIVRIVSIPTNEIKLEAFCAHPPHKHPIMRTHPNRGRAYAFGHFRHCFRCNNKIIRVKSFFEENSRPVDESGHDTHAALNMVGNFAANVSYFHGGQAAGTALYAHLAIYKVCNCYGCPYSAILEGFQATVSGGVDAISASINHQNFPSPLYYEDRGRCDHRRVPHHGQGRPSRLLCRQQGPGPIVRQQRRAMAPHSRRWLCGPEDRRLHHVGEWRPRGRGSAGAGGQLQHTTPCTALARVSDVVST